MSKKSVVKKVNFADLDKAVAVFTQPVAKNCVIKILTAKKFYVSAISREKSVNFAHFRLHNHIYMQPVPKQNNVFKKSA